MSMFILDGKLAIGKGYEVVNKVENNVSANFLQVLLYKIVVREKEALIQQRAI